MDYFRPIRCFYLQYLVNSLINDVLIKVIQFPLIVIVSSFHIQEVILFLLLYFLSSAQLIQSINFCISEFIQMLLGTFLSFQFALASFFIELHFRIDVITPGIANFRIVDFVIIKYEVAKIHIQKLLCSLVDASYQFLVKNLKIDSSLLNSEHQYFYYLWVNLFKANLLRANLEKQMVKNYFIHCHKFHFLFTNHQQYFINLLEHRLVQVV